MTNFTPEDSFAAMLAQKAELDPELVPYVQRMEQLDGSKGLVALKHKFVNEVPYFEQMNAVYNARLAAKKQHVQQAREEMQWHSYVFIHEKPWRIDAFLEIADEIENDAEYWQLAASLWTTSENIFQWGPKIKRVLLNKRPQREMMMEPEDREQFAELGDTFSVYRGHQKINAKGWSWTVDRDRAVWFAKRYRGHGFVEEGTVNKVDVVCAFLYSGESEIVVDPTKVSVSNRIKIGPS